MRHTQTTSPIAPDLEDIRRKEFSRLDAEGHIYLDYTGSGLYPESLVRAHAEHLCTTVLGNPHSRNPTSRAATRIVEEARTRVLRFFDADPAEYEIVFTPNATGALKLVAEAFGFRRGGRYVLTADNHNSAHGIREYAACEGADVRYIPLEPDLRVADVERHLAGADPAAPNLFVFPAQSNFSGVKHPLSWISAARALGYTTFLDAAAYVPTSPLSIATVAPDFACVSFYKMFGYPTGVGALIARRDALAALHRPWFSGGTVRFVSAQTGVELLYHNSRGFEDGTLNFLSISAIRSGLDFLEGIGMQHVSAHVERMTGRIIDGMTSLRHANGTPVIDIYGPRERGDRGGTVAFNVLDPDRTIWDFRIVDEMAGAASISLRTGYFCNPGAAERALAHPDHEVRRCAESFDTDSFNIQAFSDCLDHRAVGAIRVSVGIPTNTADVDRLLEFVGSFRDRPAPEPTSEVLAIAEA